MATMIASLPISGVWASTGSSSRSSGSATTQPRGLRLGSHRPAGRRANANGINVLLSVVKAPKWARPAGDTDQGPPADMNTYATFVGEMAQRYRGRVKAYEIWNEQNLYYEWGGRGRKLNAARYVELLRAAYNAIKANDPGAVVISGALTPTGYNDGDVAIDDRVYLEQMYQAGLARYCDAVGAHPSGYNNPPDADWRSFSDPSSKFGAKGHPAGSSAARWRATATSCSSTATVASASGRRNSVGPSVEGLARDLHPDTSTRPTTQRPSRLSSSFAPTRWAAPGVGWDRCSCGT